MKWGTAYGADYVNKLHAMVRRNTARPLRFICFTDNAAGLGDEVEAHPLPWTQRGEGIGDTSVFRLRVGSHADVFEALGDDPARVIRSYANEQTMASKIVGDVVFWPPSWCVSFKHQALPRWPLNLFTSARLPEGVRVVVFMGHPKPDEARDGRWPTPWYKRPIKHVRPTPWIAQHWR